MRYFLDTSIMVRALNPRDAHHALALASVAVLKRNGREPILTPQVVIESWAVATRPVGNNGLGWPPPEVAQGIDSLVIALGLVMLLDVEGIYARWRILVEQNTVKGKQVHDARIVAAMLTHGVSEILTFNDADFRRYSGITVLHPSRLTPT